jgi:hypothetical protein
MNLPLAVPFTMQTLEDWVIAFRPISIYMTDKQYAHFTNLVSANVLQYKGIPIRFLDAPKPA